MISRRLSQKILFCICLVMAGVVSADTIRIGVLAYRPKEQTQAQWLPLAESLHRKMPQYEFVIEALDYHEFDQALSQRHFDLVFTNPAHYILLKHRYDLSAPMATVVNYQGEHAFSRFGGVIFTQAKRNDLNRIQDLRGKTIAITDMGSLGGFQMQAYELLQQGLDIQRDIKWSLTNMPHDRVVEAVLAGRVDAGFIRSGVLEAMQAEGRLQATGVKVLNPQAGNYPVQLSTQLYPEWPIAAMPHLDDKLARKLTVALLTVEDDEQLTAKMNIQGFVVPADYQKVENLLRVLRVPPFNQTAELTLAQVWKHYQGVMLVVAYALLMIGFLAFRLLKVNRQLTAKQALINGQAKQLKASEQLWKFALEGAGDGVWDWQVQTGETFFSARWIEMLGYAPDEFALHYDSWVKHIHPDDQPLVMQILQTYLRGETKLYEVEFRMLCQDGSYKWILARGMVVERDAQGQPVRMVGTHADIHERKLLQIKWREGFDLLNNLAKQVPGVVYQFQWFPDGRSCFPFASQGILDIYEVTPEQVREDSALVFERLHPDDMPAINASIQRSAQTLQPWWLEYRVILPRQGVRWCLGNAQPERLADGSVLWHGYIADVTARKQDELRLQQYTEALQRSNDDLEQFAYSVSHDMRQPLRTIGGHLQLLERSLKTTLQGDNLENLHYAVEGAKRMDAMIVSLLEYSRIGRKTQPKQVIDSRQALEQALFLLESMIQQTGAVIEVKGVWPPITASLDELTRLFQNLLNNAIKYQPLEQQAHIVIDAELNAADWRVSIQDNGIGIEPSQMSRLFQFFSRLQSRSRYEGTGMGLALCRRIVEHHDGRIWVESAGEGQGCVFVFCLPAEAIAMSEVASA